MTTSLSEALIDPDKVNHILTGTLAGGSPFIFSGYANGNFSTAFRLASLPEASLVPIEVATPTYDGPQGLGDGQSMTVRTGGELGKNFAVVVATRNIEGGTIGSGLEVVGGIVNISGGSVGQRFSALDGSVVTISGGSIGHSLSAYDGSEMNISGGSLTSSFSAESGSIVNVRGGSFGSRIFVYNDSAVNFFGSNFSLDGILLDDLVAGEAFEIVDRDVTLSGLLADGSEFSFNLNTVDEIFLSCIVDPAATLTVTFTPELQLGDVNQDGIVNFLDISPFIAILSSGGFQAGADTNQDGAVNFLDISPLIALLTL